MFISVCVCAQRGRQSAIMSMTADLMVGLLQGADPTNMLLRFADTMGTSSTLGVISLGQGQGPKAPCFLLRKHKTPVSQERGSPASWHLSQKSIGLKGLADPSLAECQSHMFLHVHATVFLQAP